MIGALTTATITVSWSRCFRFLPPQRVTVQPATARRPGGGRNGRPQPIEHFKWAMGLRIDITSALGMAAGDPRSPSSEHSAWSMVNVSAAREQKGRRHSVERLHRKYAYSASGARRRSLSTDRAPSPLNGWTAYPLSEYQRRPPRAEQAVAVAAAPQCRWRGVNVVAAVEPPAVQSTVHFGRRSD